MTYTATEIKSFNDGEITTIYVGSNFSIILHGQEARKLWLAANHADDNQSANAEITDDDTGRTNVWAVNDCHAWAVKSGTGLELRCASSQAGLEGKIVRISPYLTRQLANA